MRKMQLTGILVLVGILSFFLTQTVFGQMEREMPAGESKVAEGIKATFKVTPSMSMVDIILADAATNKAITKAKVVASVKGPDGKVQEKELVGMKMGKEYSFGNTIDFSRKGNYSFDIRVEVDKRKVRFNFKYEVK